MPMSRTYTTVDGLILAETANGVTKHYTPDPQGSITSVTDNTGNELYSATYWPYGEIRTESGTRPPFGYIGALGYMRDFIQLLYVRARYLRTDLARWMSVDTYWPALQAYEYALSSPLLYVDPSGNAACQHTKRGPCDVEGFQGGCVALLCSMKAAIDIVNFIRNFIRALGGTISDIVGTLIKKIETVTTMPTPDKCCEQAHSRTPNSLGYWIAQLCQQIRGRNPWKNCADTTNSDVECIECCQKFAPQIIVDGRDSNAGVRDKCQNFCAVKQFPELLRLQ